jgi:hypothetical protein
MIMPFLPYLAVYICTRWGKFFLLGVTARQQMMSWCIGWGPRPTLPNSTSNHNEVFENILMLRIGRWIHDQAISTILDVYIFTRWKKFWGWQLGYKWCHGALVEAPDPHGMVPTSTSKIYKVFENIQSLWMVFENILMLRIGRWIHDQAISTILGSLHLYKMGEIFGVTARLQMMSWCIGWGPNPTWNGSHLHF